MAWTLQPPPHSCYLPPNDSHLSPWVIVADILLIGADAALIEGIAQALAAAGHRVLTAATIAEASFVAAAAAPLLTVADRALLSSVSDARSLGLAPGGALVVFGDPAIPLAGPLRRAVLAELLLPLERSRLTALAAHVAARAQHTGRGATTPTPPEPQPGQ